MGACPCPEAVSAFGMGKKGEKGKSRSKKEDTIGLRKSVGFS